MTPIITIIAVIAGLFMLITIWSILFMASEMDRQEEMRRQSKTAPKEVDLRRFRGGSKGYSTIEGRIRQSYGESEEE